MQSQGAVYSVLDQSFGVEEQLAYIKRERIGAEWVFSIYAAIDGEKIGYAKDFETARSLVYQNDLNPTTVH